MFRNNQLFSLLPTRLIRDDLDFLLTRAVKLNQNQIVFCYWIENFCLDQIELNHFFDFRYDSIQFDIDRNLSSKTPVMWREKI